MADALRAEIVSVGTELLLGQILDTHAPAMAQILAGCGIGCRYRHTVGDNFDRLVGVLREALERSDLVVTIGGLGPTVDDLTRDAIAAALGDALETEPEVEERLRRFFAERGYAMAESNLKQAQRPASARLIDNPNGTAPGLWCEKGGKTVIALPGPKGEFNPMANGPVKEGLSRLSGGGVIHSRTLRICDMGESAAEELVRDLMAGDNPSVAPYAHTGEVHLRLTARAETVEAAEAVIQPVAEEIQRRLGEHVFGTDGTTLEQAVIDGLLLNGATVAVAESMTGGGLGERLTSVDGASSAFLGGVIAYEIQVKERVLGVPRAVLEEQGPVSAETAALMAEGARRLVGTTYGVSITGNAGPTSDVDGKPVGLVYLGLSGPEGTETQELRYRGVREDIRRRATQAALVMIRKRLLRRQAGPSS